MEKKRLPVLPHKPLSSSGSVGQTEDKNRPWLEVSQWIFFATLCTFVLWLPLSYVAHLLSQVLTNFLLHFSSKIEGVHLDAGGATSISPNEQEKPQLFLRAASTVYFASCALSSFTSGYVVTRVYSVERALLPLFQKRKKWNVVFFISGAAALLSGSIALFFTLYIFGFHIEFLAVYVALFPSSICGSYLAARKRKG